MPRLVQSALLIYSLFFGLFLFASLLNLQQPEIAVCHDHSHHHCAQARLQNGTSTSYLEALQPLTGLSDGCHCNLQSHSPAQAHPHVAEKRHARRSTSWQKKAILVQSTEPAAEHKPRGPPTAPISI